MFKILIIFCLKNMIPNNPLSFLWLLKYSDPLWMSLILVNKLLIHVNTVASSSKEKNCNLNPEASLFSTSPRFDSKHVSYFKNQELKNSAPNFVDQWDSQQLYITQLFKILFVEKRFRKRSKLTRYPSRARNRSWNFSAKKERISRFARFVGHDGSKHPAYVGHACGNRKIKSVWFESNHDDENVFYETPMRN